MSNNISLSIQNEIKNYDNKLCDLQYKITKYININSLEVLTNNSFAINEDTNDGFEYTTNESIGSSLEIVKENASFANEIFNYKNNLNENIIEEIKKYDKNTNLQFLNNIKEYTDKNIKLDFNINRYANSPFFAFERIGYEQIPPVRIIFKNFED